MNNTEEVYKLIERLRDKVDHPFKRHVINYDIYMYLLEALGNLGYTVPDFAYSGIIQCGLCDAKEKETKQLREAMSALLADEEEY